MPSTAPVIYLHIGTRKSGTTQVQDLFRGSLRPLHEQGIRVPFRTRPRAMGRLHEPLELIDRTGDTTLAEERIGGVVARLRRSAGQRFVISLEDLAELGPAAADHLIEQLSDFETHLLVTARDWARVIPSEWQQLIKGRATVPYLDYVEQIVQNAPEAELFLRRQDVAAIVRRWGRLLPPERRHVLVVPARDAAGPTLEEMYCELVGADLDTLNHLPKTLNRSLSWAQAELLRQVNVALGPRVPEVRGDYREAVRVPLTRSSLLAMERAPLPLPEKHVAWCHARTREMYDDLHEFGVDFIGDPTHLIAPETYAAEGFSEPGSADVLDIAVRALADVTTERWATIEKKEAQLDRTLRRTTELEAEMKRLRRRLRAPAQQPLWRRMRRRLKR